MHLNSMDRHAFIAPMLTFLPSWVTAKVTAPAFTTVLVLLITSCGDRASPVGERSPTPAATPALVASVQQTSADSAGVLPQLGRQIVRSGYLRIQVEKADAAAQHADSIADQHGGFIADRQLTKDEAGRQSANLVLKIPAAHFAQALQALRLLGSVKSEGISQEDVTKAYTDVEIRLSVKQQTAERLRKLLADRTGKLSEVLDVERELSRVVTEIEQLKGERRYYDNLIALSTLNLTLFEPGSINAGSTTSIGEAFRRSLAVFATSVVWFVYLVTFLIPWIIVATILWWLVRTIRARKRAA